jgi:hypothetical protein
MSTISISRSAPKCFLRVTPNNRLQRTGRDKVLQIFKGQRPAAEPGRYAPHVETVL